MMTPGRTKRVLTRRPSDRPPDGARSDNAVRALIRSFGLLRRVMDPYFARFGISASQWGVLRALHRSEREGLRDLRLKDLGERLLVRPPSVTGTVDRLQRTGLVRRVESPSDGRARHVKITPAGRRLISLVSRGHAEQINRVLDGLTAAEQRELHRLLDRLSAHLRSMVRQDGGMEG